MASCKPCRTNALLLRSPSSAFGLSPSPGLDRSCGTSAPKKSYTPCFTFLVETGVAASRQNDHVCRYAVGAARRRHFCARTPSQCKVGGAELEIEIASFPNWRAYELWNQLNYVPKRVALAVDGRAETARQQAFTPAVPTPMMVMSLDQPVTIVLPTHELEAQP